MAMAMVMVMVMVMVMGRRDIRSRCKIGEAVALGLTLAKTLNA